MIEYVVLSPISKGNWIMIKSHFYENNYCSSFFFKSNYSSSFSLNNVANPIQFIAF